MSADISRGPEECTCQAVRQAARRITQFYDQFLVPFGVRITQFSVLAKLKSLGPMTISSLAEELVMDRTTLGRNILPLEREGLVQVVPCRTDRRSKEVLLTQAGAERLQTAREGWSTAQTQFAAAFGEERAVALRALLREASSTDLPPESTAGG